MDELEPLLVDLAKGRPGALGRITDHVERAWRSDSRDDADDALDALAARATRGDQAALGVLLSLTDKLALARGSVRKVLVRDEDVDDALQRTLISVSRGIAAFRGGSRYRTWLYRVARNEALQVIRSHQRTARDVGFETVEPTAFVGFLSSVVANKAMIDDAIESLPEPFREAVILRDMQGMEYRDIAAALHIQVGTVSSRVARGRTLVRERLGDVFGKA